MSQLIYPSIIGLSFNSVKEPEFFTNKVTAANGRELRYKYIDSPQYNFQLEYEFLRDLPNKRELKKLAGFFMSLYGVWDSFLFLDPDDSIAINMQFGLGDGVTTQFQLTRTFGNFTEDVFNVVITAIDPAISFTVDNKGLITFSEAPEVGIPLYWSGKYYFVCRFKDDGMDLEKFLDKLWTNKKCQFKGALNDMFGVTISSYEPPLG